MNISNETIDNSTDYDYLGPPEVDPGEILADIITMAMLGSLGTIFGVAGLVIVKKNTILKGIIEHYALVDLINLIIINSCHLIWGVPCAIWGLNEWSPVIDYIFSGLAFSSVSIGFPPKLLLGINRFFALAFEGRFYKRFEETLMFQYILMTVYPLGTAIGYAIPGCHAIFIPYGQNFFFVEGDCGMEIMWYTQVLASYIFLPISTFFDITVFYLMRKRIRAFQSAQSHQNSKQKAEQLRKELRLAAQMICNLITGITLTVSIGVAQNYLASTIATFLIYTALWQICSLVTCMSCVILLIERKPKDLGVTLTVSSTNTQQTTSRINR